MKPSCINLPCALLLLQISAVAADELKDLKREVAELTRKIELLEQQQVATRKAIEPVVMAEMDDYVVAGNQPGTIKLPGSETSFRFQGFVQADYVYDIGPRPTARGGDAAVVQTAMLEGNPEYEMRGDARLNARNTRLGFVTTTPTAYGLLRTQIDGDFTGPPNDKASRATTSRTTFGLNNAYAEWGNFLTGQAGSNFQDLSVLPIFIAAPGPAGQVFVRQGQVRYTLRFGTGQRLALALENPKGDFADSGDSNLDDGLPDLTVHYRHETDRWHYQFGGLLRRIGIDEGINGGKDDTVGAWGLTHSGSYKMFDTQDRLSWSLVMGNGLGRYLDISNNQGASLDSEGKLNAQLSYGGFLAYRHWWNTTLQTNMYLGMSVNDVNPPLGAGHTGAGVTDEDNTPDVNRRLYSAHMNLVWFPVERVRLGVEYIWARREVQDGRSGGINRIQMNSLFYF